MRIFISTLLLLFELLQVPDYTRGDDFGYDGVIGPSHWGERYRECAGKHQSPININILRVKQVTLPDLVLIGFDDKIDGVHVTNNGHTVLIEVENEPHPRVRGGPLEGDYIFSQMHFHWGDNDTFGSEDKINHRSFPMELHMVFFKEEYNSTKEAVLHPDGLTVLAFFYEVKMRARHGNKDGILNNTYTTCTREIDIKRYLRELDRHFHPAYDEITTALSNVTEPHSSVVMTNPFSFLNILPYDLRRYFTYRGSLTTPPCSEVVIWLDFEQPVRLAHDQIEVFRELRSAHGKIKHNFRPIQPIGDRVVFYNIDSNYFVYNEIDDPDEDETATAKSGRKKKGRNHAHKIYSQFGPTGILILIASVNYL